jgi:hypothetical protein
MSDNPIKLRKTRRDIKNTLSDAEIAFYFRLDSEGYLCRNDKLGWPRCGSALRSQVFLNGVRYSCEYIATRLLAMEAERKRRRGGRPVGGKVAPRVRPGGAWV